MGPVDTVVVSTTLFFTIIFALVFGILAGYAAVMGLLRALGGHSRVTTAPAPAALTAMRTSSVTGD